MAPRPQNDDVINSSGQPRDAPAPPGIPRWLKISALVVILSIALVVGISLIAGVQHGPGQFGPGQHGPGGYMVTSADG